MTVSVRDATPADWAQIWLFLREIVTAGETFAYDVAMGEREARSMWLVTPPGRTTVAVNGDGTVVGSANMYANRAGPGSHVASGSFMVAPAHWGCGVGRALCVDALEWAEEVGFRAVQFNAVVETNFRALRLYRSLGFEVVGTVPGAFRHPTEGYVGLCILYRGVGAQAPHMIDPSRVVTR